MKIRRETWQRYIDALRLIDEKAAAEMRRYIGPDRWPDTEEGVELLIRYAYRIAGKYGEAAATLAAEMYDATALLSGIHLPSAIPAETATLHETAKAVVGTLKTGNEEIVTGAVKRLVRMAGQDTTLQNARRDGAQWAWIASGDTCAFCIALAANGWQNASKKTMKGKHAEHIHANCDCAFAIRFDSGSEVEGYDPETYERMLYPENDELDGESWEMHIDGLRRRLYAENRETINAQKRSAYAKRQERESSRAEEADIT